MDLKIITSRLTNFLLFVKEKNKKGLRKINSKCLDNNFKVTFFWEDKNKVWDNIEEKIGKRDKEKVKKIFSNFNDDFKLIWKKQKDNLLLWRDYFKKNKKLIKKIVEDIKDLLGVKRFRISDIPIYLVLDYKNKDNNVSAWFSWDKERRFVVITIPIDKKPSVELFSIGVLSHEIFHLALKEKKEIISNLRKISKNNVEVLKSITNNIPPEKTLEELLISSFIPEGLISEKYLNHKIEKPRKPINTLLEYRRLIAYNLKSLAGKYIKEGRRIDQDYIKKIIEAIKS